MEAAWAVMVARMEAVEIWWPEEGGISMREVDGERLWRCRWDWIAYCGVLVEWGTGGGGQGVLDQWEKASTR